MSQISENPDILPLIDDLLDESGSELYMKPVSNYVKIGVPVDSYTLTESAARKGEVYVGYRLVDKDSNSVTVNPIKSDSIIFSEKDRIIVISENQPSKKGSRHGRLFRLLFSFEKNRQRDTFCRSYR